MKSYSSVAPVATTPHVTIVYNNDFDTPSSSANLSSDQPEDPFSSHSQINSADILSGDTARASVFTVAEQIRVILSDVCGISTTLYPVTSLDDVKTCAKQAENTNSLVFNLCESLHQDARFEAKVATALHSAKIPYTGNGPKTLSLCLNKYRTTKRLEKFGVPVPISTLIRRISHIPSTITFPCIVKPNREDGSTAIESSSVVHTREELIQQIKKIIKVCRQAALIQEFIDGREISVSLLGNKPPKILGIGEIDFSTLTPGLPKIVTYLSKWAPGTPEYNGTKPIAAELSDKQRQDIQRTASLVAEAVQLSGYGRIDMRLSSDGIPYVIDVNPNCDLDPEAGLAKTAERNGISYRQLVIEVIDAGLQARKIKKDRSSFRKVLSLLQLKPEQKDFISSQGASI